MTNGWIRPYQDGYWERQRYYNERREMLMAAQDGRCALCGKLFSPNLHETEDHWRPSVDHVIPRSYGGPNRLGNYLLAHRKCNHDKGDRVPTGCELIWLLAVNNRLGVEPLRW